MASAKVRKYSAAEVMDLIKNDIPFIRGITVSGGECSLQRDFAVELFALAKQHGLSTLMDSNGSYDNMGDKELMAVCDGVMLDVKVWNEQQHRKLTGRGSQPVIENAIKLAEAGKLEEIRTVVVPDYLDNEETVDRITRVLAPYLAKRQIRYRVSAYCPFGVREPYYSRFRVPTHEGLEKLAEIARNNGFTDLALVSCMSGKGVY